MGLYRSKVIEIYDFQQMDLNDLIEPFEVDEARLEHDLMLMRKQNAGLLDVDVVEKDDFATIRCESELPRFQKDAITVKVGKGLYNKALENGMIGQKIGEERTIFVDGTPVRAAVLKVQRHAIPELTDETVASWNLPRISTVDALRNSYIDAQHKEDTEETIEQVAQYIQSVVAGKSVFELDPEEEKKERAHGDMLLREMYPAASNGGEQPSDTDRQMVYDMFMNTLKINLIGDQLTEQAGIAPTKEDYERAVQDEMAYSAESREEVLARFPWESFERSFRGEYYVGMIKKHIRQFIMEKEY